MTSPNKKNKQVMMIYNILEENSKSIKDNNLSRKHNYAIGSLVNVKIGEAYTQMWVVGHDRDCDGTPLYTISLYKNPNPLAQHLCRGFPEESLTIIENS